MKSLKIILALTFISFALLFFLTDNISISLFFNSHHTPLGNNFFFLISSLGEKFFFIFVGMMMYFIKKKKCIPFGLSFINFTIIVQVLKRIIFVNSFRPNVILPQLFPHIVIDTIPFLRFHKNFSFPSGHATMIFSLIILLIYAFEIKNIFYQIALVIIAIFVAMSRVYLMQHFFIDVYFGALIGSLTTFITIHYFEKYKLNDREPFKTILNILKI